MKQNHEMRHEENESEVCGMTASFYSQAKEKVPQIRAEASKTVQCANKF